MWFYRYKIYIMIFNFKYFFIYILCASVFCCVYRSVLYAFLVPIEDKIGHGTHETGVRNCCVVTYGC